MQSTSLFIASLLLSTVVLATNLQHQSTVAISSGSASKDIEFLEKSKTGSMLLSLAQLHLQMGGPVEDLEDAISELYADLDQKISDENNNWAVTSNAHEKRVDELQSNIDYADGDVKTSIQKLENVLVPLEQQIADEIETVTDRIQVNDDAIEREKSQRESDASDYNEKVKEHQDGIDACDEAIKLVNELMNSSPSLIQIRKAKNSVANIQKKLGKKNQYSPLIKALTQLAIDQNFSDQETVQKIVDLLENLRENLTSSLQSINNDEKTAQQNYQDWLDQLNQELDELETTLDQRKLDAQTTKSKNFLIKVFIILECFFGCL